MYLRTIAIHGFKSFAHPVQIELSPGLNVIVGPNGSGKSNLIDALRWVLAERRGGHQVFFHGSAKYRPVGMASVELLFEPPFRVEKRAFASGEVEYFLQGTKVRLGDFRQKLAAAGLSVEHLGVGFVTHRDLHALADVSPSERLRWLEEVSGVLDMRAKLAHLSHLLQGVVEKRERFRERLREVALHRARVAEWAEKEAEYLRREKRLLGARKVYCEKLLEALRKDHARLLEEEAALDGELLRLAREEDSLSLPLEEERLLALRRTLSSLRGEREKKKRALGEKERELYQLLTEIREAKKARWTLQAQEAHLLEELENLAEEGRHLEPPFRGGLWLERTVAVVKRFVDAKREALFALEREERKLREDIARFEAALKSVEREWERSMTQESELSQDIEHLERALADLMEEWRRSGDEKKICEAQKAETLRNLERVREIVARIQRACERVESWRTPDEVVEKMCLFAQSWPNRAIHGFLGFLQNVQVLKEGGIPEDGGQWMMFSSFLPPHSLEWEVAPREAILSRLRKGEALEKNLVALDGSVVALKGGIFLFPRRVVRDARFVESWKRRMLRYARKQEELENLLERTRKTIEDTEKQQRAIELRMVQWRERLSQKQKARQSLEERIADLSREKARLLGYLQEAREKLCNIREKMDLLKAVLSRAERTLKLVEERRHEEEMRKKQREEFLRKGQRVLERALRLEKEAKERAQAIRLLAEAIARCGQELGELLKDTVAQEGLLQETEEKVRRFAESLEEQREKKRALERRRERLLRERERLRFAQEKLQGEIERTEALLATLEGDGSLEFHAMDLDALRRFIEEEERALAGTPVRRGALEEYEALRSREEDLARQDAFFGDLITLASLEWKDLERSVHRRFLSFIEDTKDAFSRYFGRIFQGGRATLAVGEKGAHIEVEIPGKKRQGIASLSSGERAIVALCFLCACFEAGGAKMCFFDEIDVHLDHTNSVLLAQVLKDFAASRQVVVVTHKEEVMEVADRILGVTMGEPGVSQVLPCATF